MINWNYELPKERECHGECVCVECIKAREFNEARYECIEALKAMEYQGRLIEIVPL